MLGVGATLLVDFRLKKVDDGYGNRVEHADHFLRSRVEQSHELCAEDFDAW